MIESVDNGQRLKQVNVKELDIELIKLLNDVRRIEKNNFQGSVQELMFAHLREYMKNRVD